MKAEEFGPFLTEQRKVHNMTQAQLADALFVSKSAVSKWERGLCLPEISRLEDIARVLELSVMEVLKCERSTAVGEPGYKEEDVEAAISSVIQVAEEEKKRIRRKIILVAAFIAVVIGATVFVNSPRPIVLEAERAQVTLVTDRGSSAEDIKEVAFTLSAEDTEILNEILKDLQSDFSKEVLKLAFNEYLKIEIDGRTAILVGIETTTYRDRTGHYVMLLRAWGRDYKIWGTFMEDGAYQRLIELMRKYDETLV